MNQTILPHHEFMADQPPVQVRDYPDSPIRLVVDHEPRTVEAETAASVHLAREAQKRERQAVIDANLSSAAVDKQMAALYDSVESCRLAEHMDPKLPIQQRREAQAVAVRLHQREWEAITRYRAADATLMRLRSFLSRHALGALLSDDILRQEADAMAGLSHRARLRAWTGQDAVSDTEWAKAQLGMLSLTEDR